MLDVENKVCYEIIKFLGYHFTSCACMARSKDEVKIRRNIFSTIRKKLRRNPIEGGAISGFSGKKSVPE